MRRISLLSLCVSICISIGTAAAQSLPESAPADARLGTHTRVNGPDGIVDMEVMVVTGVQPGPGMWKVRNSEGHTLWILGTLSPLPTKMQWRSDDVEAVIASAQEIISSPGMSITTGQGKLRSLLLVPSLFKARRNPDGKTLQDVVPAGEYARWQVLKERYIGRDAGVEKWRPIFAAPELYEAAMKHAGLSQANIVRPLVEKMAKAHKVPVTTANVEITILEPKQAIKEFQQTTLADTECFSRTLAHIEVDLDNMRARANAWAVGDIEALRGTSSGGQYAACLAAVSQSAIAKRLGVNNLRERSMNEWQRLVEAALARNEVTFSTLSMGVLLERGGVMDALRAKGYMVEAPE